MATQSSVAVLFRGFVMLACLVVIPLVALFGKSLPDVLNALLEGRFSHVLAAAQDQTDTTDPLQPVEPTRAAGMIAPSWMSAAEQQAPRQTGRNEPLSSVGPGPSGVVAASYDSQVQTGRPEPQMASGVEPRRLDEPVFPAVSPALVRQSPSPADRFTVIQNRLRQLGATYYLLESWGSCEQLFRFYCKVAVAGNPDYTHFFEATDSEPLEAMGQVLQQVEAWRSARQ